MATTIPTARELGITGKQERLVYECVAGGGSHTLSDIRWHLLESGIMARETAISARIRDINRRLRPNGFEITWRYAHKGVSNTLYQLEAKP